MTSTADALLEARDLVKVYGEGHAATRAVDGISVRIAPGELVLVTGPSGSGKTTLLSMLGALLRPTSGEVIVGGVDAAGAPAGELPRIRAQKIGFIFQAFNLLEALSAVENVAFAASLVPGGSLRAALPEAAELLERLGLGHRLLHRPRALSGGEKQRVAIARALINDPPLILADEPTGNLDSHSGQEVMMVLHDIVRDEGRAALIVTHDPRIEEIADRILWLEDGRLRDRKAERHDWVRDPVCGMRVDAWTATITMDVDDARVVFCSSRCRERFEMEPGAYPGSAAPGSLDPSDADEGRPRAEGASS